MFAAARADSVRTFFDSQQRLIDVGDHLRLAFTQTQRKLLTHIHQRHIDSVFDAVVGKFERSGLIGAHVFRVLLKFLVEGPS